MSESQSNARETNGSVRDLRAIQEWMQAVITHPDGVAAGIDSSAARERIPITADEVASVVRPSRALDSVARLEIYANAYYARLLDCLRQEFPSFVHAVGEEIFDGFAFGYLQDHPSRSYTLGELGTNFPRYLRETRPQDRSSAEADWTDFLIDLATLERTYSEVFDGPGTEDEPLLQEAELRAIAPERWPECRLVPVVCLRLASFRHPVHEYATAVRTDRNPEIPSPAATWLAITRRDYVVRRTAISHPQFVLLEALVSNRTVGEAIQRAVEIWPGEPETLAAELGAWFRQWAQAGYFRRVEQ